MRWCSNHVPSRDAEREGGRRSRSRTRAHVHVAEAEVPAAEEDLEDEDPENGFNRAQTLMRGAAEAADPHRRLKGGTEAAGPPEEDEKKVSYPIAGQHAEVQHSKELGEDRDVELTRIRSGTPVLGTLCGEVCKWEGRRCARGSGESDERT